MEMMKRPGYVFLRYFVVARDAEDVVLFLLFAPNYDAAKAIRRV
jgi:hypothetical protein